MILLFNKNKNLEFYKEKDLSKTTFILKIYKIFYNLSNIFNFYLIDKFYIVI